MRKIVTQLIVEAKDRTTAVFKSILASVRSTGKAVKDQGSSLDGATKSVEKLATADKKLSIEQRKLDTSAAKLAIAERQLAAQFKKIAVDAKNASTAEQKLAVEQKRLAAASKSLTNDQRRLAIQQKQVGLNAKIAAKNQGEFSRGVKTSSKNVSKLGGTLRSAGKTLLAFFAVRQVIQFAKGIVQTADAFKLIQARIRLATNGTREYVSANASLFVLAQRTRTSFNDLATLFSRTSISIKNLGLSQKETLRFTETIAKATKISGASAASSNAAITQLIQGLQGGVLRGQEFNSVVEQTPRIAQALAAGLRVPIEALRGLAEAGEISAAAVIKAVLSQSEAIDKEFKTIPRTVQDSVTQLTNIWNKGIGELDDGSDFSKIIIAVFDTLKVRLTSAFDFLKNNASGIREGFEATVSALTIFANGTRIAFNLLTASISAAGIVITGVLEGLARVAAAVTFGDLSKEWELQANAIRAVSEALAKQIESDSFDIFESLDGFSKGLESTAVGQEKLSTSTDKAVESNKNFKNSIDDNKKSIDKQTDSTDKLTAAQEKQLDQEAKQLFDQTRTAVEKLNVKQARYKELLDAGKISQDTFNRALRGANEASEDFSGIDKSELSASERVAQNQLEWEREKTRLKQEQLELDRKNPFLQARLRDAGQQDDPRFNAEADKFNFGKVEIPTKIIPPTQEELEASLKDVDANIDVSMQPDAEAAIASINQTRDQAQEQVKPIVIPVVFENQGGNSFSDKSFADELKNEAVKRGRVR